METKKNLTYIISPGFPNLIDQPMNCSVVVKKIGRLVSQLRIDFLHFNIVSIYYFQKNKKYSKLNSTKNKNSICIKILKNNVV